MNVTSENRKAAISALGRTNGYPDLKRLFESGKLDRKFAIDEIRRSIYIFERHFMIGELSTTSNIPETEVKDIAGRLVLGLCKSAEYKLKIGASGEAHQILEHAGDVIADYGFVRTPEVWNRYHDLYIRVCDQMNENIRIYGKSQHRMR